MTASAQPSQTAHVIHSDAEAIAVAHKLAARFAIEASARDRERRLPVVELDEFSASGLWGITIPKEYGGAGVSYVTVAEVIKIISAADPSLGQIPQNHLGVLDILLQTATEAQKRYYFGKVLQGYRFGNAFSESKSKKMPVPLKPVSVSMKTPRKSTVRSSTAPAPCSRTSCRRWRSIKRTRLSSPSSSATIPG